MNNTPSKTTKLCLDLGDKLTTISCGHIVVEIVKFLVYQRLQIPYTYQWLKQIISKRKSMENVPKIESFQSERHFRLASASLDNLDFILKSLLQEISGAAMPEEICLTLGATPVTCKEVYRLLLPTMCHKPQCQSTDIAKDSKLQNIVFRSLVTSSELSQAFSNNIPPTNLHAFIRRKVTNHFDLVHADSFVPASGSKIPRNSQVIVIDFRSKNSGGLACCNDFKIFGDINGDVKNYFDENNQEELHEIQSSDTMKWYQSTYVMKGFKDCVVNGKSVTNSWLG